MTLKHSPRNTETFLCAGSCHPVQQSHSHLPFRPSAWISRNSLVRPASSAELDYHQHMEQLLYAVMLLQLEGLYCRSCSDQSVPLGRKGALFEMLCVINQHSKVLPAAGGGGGERHDCRLSLNCLGSPLCVFHQGLLLAFLQIY